MKERNNLIICGFRGFELEFDRDTGFVDVKYKGDSLSGVIHASVVGYDPKLAESGIPILKLEILADV